jgi:hypothetical protein
MTPAVLRSGPYRVFFYAADRDEPPHVHVRRDDAIAKFWLDLVRLEESRRFRSHELRVIERLLEDHRRQLLEQWHEFRAR